MDWRYLYSLSGKDSSRRKYKIEKIRNQFYIPWLEVMNLVLISMKTQHNWYFAQARGAVFIRMALLICLVQRAERVIDVI